MLINLGIAPLISHQAKVQAADIPQWGKKKLLPLLTATAESKCANSGLADCALVDYGFMYSDVDWSAQNGCVSSQGCSGVRLHKGDECDSLSNTIPPLARAIQNMRQSSQQAGTQSP